MAGKKFLKKIVFEGLAEMPAEIGLPITSNKYTHTAMKPDSK